MMLAASSSPELCGIREARSVVLTFSASMDLRKKGNYDGKERGKRRRRKKGTEQRETKWQRIVRPRGGRRG